MAEIKYIPVSKLWRHPDNPRKDLGDVTSWLRASRSTAYSKTSPLFR